MHVVVLQPPYPTAATPTAATDCLAWQERHLAGLAAQDVDFVLLPEYANAPGLEGTDLAAFAREPGARFAAGLAAEARRLQA